MNVTQQLSLLDNFATDIELHRNSGTNNTLIMEKSHPKFTLPFNVACMHFPFGAKTGEDPVIAIELANC